MSNVTEDLSQQDMIRIMNRDRFVKEQLSTRCASLIQENLELVGIVRELQQDLAELHQGEQMVAATTPTNEGNGDVVGDQPKLAFTE